MWRPIRNDNKNNVIIMTLSFSVLVFQCKGCNGSSGGCHMVKI